MQSPLYYLYRVFREKVAIWSVMPRKTRLRPFPRSSQLNFEHMPLFFQLPLCNIFLTSPVGYATIFSTIPALVKSTLTPESEMLRK